MQQPLPLASQSRGISTLRSDTVGCLMSSRRPLAITGGGGWWWGWRGRELRRRAASRSFVSAGVTHAAEGRRTPCINQAARLNVPGRFCTEQNRSALLGGGRRLRGVVGGITMKGPVLKIVKVLSLRPTNTDPSEPTLSFLVVLLAAPFDPHPNWDEPSLPVG